MLFGCSQKSAAGGSSNDDPNYGNTVGNLRMGGEFLDAAGYVYYPNPSDGNRLWRKGEDGSNPEKVSDGYCKYLNYNAADGMIYYVADNGAVDRMKPDGSENAECTNTNFIDGSTASGSTNFPIRLIFYKGVPYFTYADGDVCKIYTSTDIPNFSNRNLKLLVDNVATSGVFYILNDKIYYTDLDSKKRFSAGLDGSAVEGPFDSAPPSAGANAPKTGVKTAPPNGIPYKGRIVHAYSGTDGKCKVVSYAPDGSDEKLIAQLPTMAGYYNIMGDTLYVNALSLYAVKLDGKGDPVLLDPAKNIENIYTAGGTVYYQAGRTWKEYVPGK